MSEELGRYEFVHWPYWNPMLKVYVTFGHVKEIYGDQWTCAIFARRSLHDFPQHIGKVTMPIFEGTRALSGMDLRKRAERLAEKWIGEGCE